MATILEDKPTQAESDEDPEKTHEKDADFGASMGRAIEEHEKAKQRRQQTPAPITPNLSAPVEQEAVETNPFRQALERKKSDIGQWFAQRLTTAVNTEASFEYGQHGDWLGITRDLARLKQARFEIKGEKKRDILDQIKVGMKHYENDPMAFSEILTNLKYLDKDFDVTEYQEKFKELETDLVRKYQGRKWSGYEEIAKFSEKMLRFEAQGKYLGLSAESDSALKKVVGHWSSVMLKHAESPYQKALIVARLKYVGNESSLSWSKEKLIQKEVGTKLDEYSQKTDTAEPFAKLYSIYNNRHFGGRRALAEDERARLSQKFNELTQKNNATEQLVNYTGDLFAVERAARRVHAQPENAEPTPQETAEIVQYATPEMREAAEATIFSVRAEAESIAKEEQYPEDNIDVTLIDKENRIFGIFDGVSGVTAGGASAEQARRSIQQFLSEKLREIGGNPSLVQVQDIMKQAFQEGHKDVLDLPHTLKRKSSDEWIPLTVGTTGCVATIVEGNKGEKAAVIGSVGDSRAYIVNATGELEQITLDDEARLLKLPEDQRREIQSALAEASGREELEGKTLHGINLASALASNALGKMLGQNALLENVQIYTVPLNDGDRIILVTDGVSANLRDSQIGISRNFDPNTEMFAKDLVRRAREVSESKTGRAKKDDISAVVIDIDIKPTAKLASEQPEVASATGQPELLTKQKLEQAVKQSVDEDFARALEEVKKAEAAKAEVPTTEPRPEPVSPSTPQPEATAPNLEEKRQQIEALLKQHRDIAAKAPDRKSQQAQVIERLQALLPDKFTGATIAKIVHGKNDTRVWLQVEDRQKRPTIEQLFGWEPSEPKVGKDKTDTSAAPGTSTHATPQAPEKPKGRTDNLADAFDRAIQKQREREEAKKTTEPELPIPTPKKKEPPAPPAPEPVSNPEPPQAKEPEKTAASPEPEPKKAADAQEPREVVTDVPYLHIPEEDQRKIESLDRDALIEEINQHLDTEKSERPRDTKIDGFYMDLFEDSADLLRKLTSQLNKEKRNKKKIAEFERGIFRQVRRSLPKKPDQDIALLSKERIQWIEKCDALLRRYAELIGEQPQEKGKAA